MSPDVNNPAYRALTYDELAEALKATSGEAAGQQVVKLSLIHI